VTAFALDASAATVVDVFSRDRPPVLTVSPGDTLVVRTLDASGYLERPAVRGERPRQLLTQSQGHCLTGPIAVDGAGPGDVLSVHLRSLVPGEWGWTVAGAHDTALNRRLGIVPGELSWLLWDLDVEQGTATESRGFRRRLAPFLGVVGLAPAEPGEHSTVPPRRGTGGNVDCRELTVGSTLYLPVEVDGALLSVGDGHAAQGDGEVGGTAIECSMTTELVVDLAPEPPVPGVHAVTPSARLTFGFDADLNAASADALDAMVTWVQALHALDRTTALALASTVVDLRITQIANRTWGVHAVLRHDALERAGGEVSG
jgi:acetamidase/formamidase